MKIAIVTQALGPNLGGIIQNWALQQALESIGHKPTTINFTNFEKITFRHRLRITARNIRTLIRRCCGVYNRFSLPSDSIPSQANLDFIRSHISATPECKSYSPVEGAEAYIVGSDQVWRPRYNKGVLPDCFLKFTDGLSVKRIAYAASFGTDSWEFDPSMTQECRILARKFDAISVREISGIDLCKRFLDCNAVQLIDPTLLIDADRYRQISAPSEEKPYTAAYILDYEGNKREFVRKTAREGKLIDINPHRTSVPEWLGTIADADRVITDSFHGAVFSIIFKRPFAVIANPERGNSRMESLLDSLGLRNRLVFSPNEVDSVFSSEIDWTDVDSRLAPLKEHALSFLKNSLKQE